MLEEQRAKTGATGYAQPPVSLAARTSTCPPSPVEPSFDVADSHATAIDHDDNASELSEDLWLSLTPSVEEREIASQRPVPVGVDGQATSRAMSVLYEADNHDDPHQDEKQYRGRSREPKLLNPCARNCNCASVVLRQRSRR